MAKSKPKKNIHPSEEKDHGEKLVKIKGREYEQIREVKSGQDGIAEHHVTHKPYKPKKYFFTAFLLFLLFSAPVFAEEKSKVETDYIRYYKSMTFDDAVLKWTVGSTYSFSKNCFDGVKEIKDSKDEITIIMNVKEECKIKGE